MLKKAIVTVLVAISSGAELKGCCGMESEDDISVPVRSLTKSRDDGSVSYH